MHREQFVKMLNQWGKERISFFFMVDFELKNFIALPLGEVPDHEILYDFNGRTNAYQKRENRPAVQLQKLPSPKSEFEKKFSTVFSRLEYGDSYLTNLTMKTEVETDLSLADLFFASKARY